MNDTKLESLLLGARPYKPTEYSLATLQIMERIRSQQYLHRQLEHTSTRKSLFMRVRALHGVGLVIAIVATIVVLSGIAYASVQYLPDLIKLFGKTQNAVGRTEYSVPAFRPCYKQGDITLDKFEVAPDAHLGDGDVEKTLRAKCELLGLSKFANDTWPTHADHTKWLDGDTIYYARPDIRGTVVSRSDSEVTIQEDSGYQKTFPLLKDHSLEVYAHGEKVAGNAAQKGDYVFAIVRATEIYHTDPFKPGAQTPPVERGLLAVVKASQPARYYGAMQQYVTEVVPCMGNPTERCSNAPDGLGFEIFPRLGEGGRPESMFTDRGATIGRTINGTVSDIGKNSLTIKASSGAIYSIGIGQMVVDSFNATISAQDTSYGDEGAVRLQKGSWIEVRYDQTNTESPKRVANEDIVSVMLLTNQFLNKK